MTSVLLHGCDGTTWDLLDRTSPVTLTAGLGGLHLPKASHRWSSTAARPGRTWKGAVLDARTFTMSVLVGDPQPPFRTGDDWRELDGQFWAALSHEESATLVVNGERSLNVRLDDDNDTDFPKDPALIGKAVYDIALVADRPEWLGATVTRSFDVTPAASANYYGATKGPPFTISAPAIGRTASISNIGDLPAYPVWRIVGPATTAEVGVGDSILTIPFALQAGEQVIIDTERQTIVSGSGENLWPRMGFASLDFAPVPSGGQVPIAIGLEDSGATSLIEITLTPRFRRAWGGGAN